jgi:hypothetical protein
MRIVSRIAILLLVALTIIACERTKSQRDTDESAAEAFIRWWNASPHRNYDTLYVGLPGDRDASSSFMKRFDYSGVRVLPHSAFTPDPEFRGSSRFGSRGPDIMLSVSQRWGSDSLSLFYVYGFGPLSGGSARAILHCVNGQWIVVREDMTVIQ